MQNNNSREELPSNARLVFKGLVFEVWQWEQKMFNGTTELFERVWRLPTAEVIATVGDKIIIEEQDQPDKKNIISLPGGIADKSDDILEEAKRELLEETGYRSDDWEFFLKHEKIGRVLYEIYCFIARNCVKAKDPQLDAGEKIKTKLISFDDFIMLSEEPRFLVSPEFINYLLRIQLSPKKKEEFQKLLFPSNRF